MFIAAQICRDDFQKKSFDEDLRKGSSIIFTFSTFL
jgi:hypothetical protein